MARQPQEEKCVGWLTTWKSPVAAMQMEGARQAGFVWKKGILMEVSVAQSPVDVNVAVAVIGEQIETRQKTYDDYRNRSTGSGDCGCASFHTAYLQYLSKKAAENDHATAVANVHCYHPFCQKACAKMD